MTDEAAKPELVKKEFLAEIKLKTPLTVFDNEITILTLKNPDVALIRKLDDPYIIVDGGVKPINETCAKYIEKLGGLPHNGSNLMNADDFNTAKWAVVGFFCTFEMPVSLTS